MTIDRMEGGDLEAKEQPQSLILERSCLCGRYIDQCFLGALATFVLTLFIDVVLLSHDAITIVGGASEWDCSEPELLSQSLRLFLG